MEQQIIENGEGCRLLLGDLSVTVLRHGAKIQNICWNGREWLAQQQPGSSRPSAYGDDFLACGPSGFDEMFPNITAGPYPGGLWDGLMLPDHGEVWSRDWAGEPEPGGLSLRIDGVALPYRLERHIRLSRDTIHLFYRAENPSQYPMQYIWAAHPLFVLEDGMRLELPGCRNIFNAAEDPGNLGAFGQVHPWPMSKAGRDMRLLSGTHHTYNKYYVWNAREENRALLHYPDGTCLTLAASAYRAPYMGIWTDEEGHGERPMRCVALEPCTGALDRLDLSEKYQKDSILMPQGAASWQLTISFAKESET